MVKKDITDKLNFEEKPALVIKGEEIEVNGDAPAVLRVMSLMAKTPGPAEITSAYEAMFPEESRCKLEKLNISFKGLVTVINEAIRLIVGENDEGEA